MTGKTSMNQQRAEQPRSFNKMQAAHAVSLAMAKADADGKPACDFSVEVGNGTSGVIVRVGAVGVTVVATVCVDESGAPSGRVCLNCIETRGGASSKRLDFVGYRTMRTMADLFATLAELPSAVSAALQDSGDDEGGDQ